jgi:hypothetical protein
MTPESANPFEILRLDPSATEEEIVRQAGRLRQRSTDETALNEIRQAVQALTAHPQERLLLGLLTHPAPLHHWPALDRFAVAFRRPPASADPTGSCPPLDLKEFGDLLMSLAAKELEAPSSPFESVASSESVEEVSLQTAEALWQSLIFEPGA